MLKVVSKKLEFSRAGDHSVGQWTATGGRKGDRLGWAFKNYPWCIMVYFSYNFAVNLFDVEGLNIQVGVGNK